MDQVFLDEEAEQLERTLAAFLRVLADERLENGIYCSAFGIAFW
jgi:hypothetical protein